MKGLRERLQERDVVLGTMVRDILSLNIVEVILWAALYFFFVNMEHAAVDVAGAGPLLQYTQIRGLDALVRVPTLDKAFIGRLLDCGASGVWLPHLDTPEDARKLAFLGRYPPSGGRGGTIPWTKRAWAQTFAKLGDFFAQVDRQVALIGQIESKEAVDNIDAILETGLLDAVVIGPLDLSLDLGIAGDFKHAELEKAIFKVLEAGQKRGVSVGLHTGNLEDLQTWHKRGMNFLVYSYDLVLMAEGLKQAKATLLGP